MYRPHLLLLNVLKIQGTFPSCSCICICLLWGRELPLAGVVRNSLSRPLSWQPHHSWRARTLGTACAAAGGGCGAVLGEGQVVLGEGAAAARQAGEQQPGHHRACSSLPARGAAVGCPLCLAHPALGRAVRHRTAATALGHPRAARSCAVVPATSRCRAAGGLLGGPVTPPNSHARAAGAFDVAQLTFDVAHHATFPASETQSTALTPVWSRDLHRPWGERGCGRVASPSLSY